MPLVERHLPADMHWKGNRRKRGFRAPVPATAKRPGGRSLDSFKQLATSEKSKSMADVLKEETDATDRRKKAWSMYTGLLDTMKQLVWHEEEQRAAMVAKETAKAPRADSGPRQRKSRAWRAAKDYNRLAGCQSEWIGFAPKCGGRIQSVPVNCNHRLCPLCNVSRAERYRGRVKTLFHELANPQLLTLTVPSPRYLTRETLDTLRQRLRAFLREHKALLLGGVYSIEITFNPRTETWHPHVHVLVDVAGEPGRLPYKQFMERKLRLEFAWLVLTQGKRRRGEVEWKAADYDVWAAGVRDGLVSAGDGRNRRVVDLRNVTRDRKAAMEVMKYMAKGATYIGHPGPLRELLLAVRGLRQIQTFGSCYNVNLDAEDSPTAGMVCECGRGCKFEPIGRFGLGMVYLSPDGKWYVRDDAPLHGRQRSRGDTNQKGHTQWHS